MEAISGGTLVDKYFTYSISKEGFHFRTESLFSKKTTYKYADVSSIDELPTETKSIWWGNNGFRASALLSLFGAVLRMHNKTTKTYQPLKIDFKDGETAILRTTPKDIVLIEIGMASVKSSHNIKRKLE